LYFEQPKHRARRYKIIKKPRRDAGPPSDHRNMIWYLNQLPRGKPPKTRSVPVEY
jgi:hypothetical protein